MLCVFAHGIVAQNLHFAKTVVEWISRISVGILLTNPRTTAALHLDSTCRESLDTVASLFIVARLTITSAAFPLAETLHVSAPPVPKTDCTLKVSVTIR